MNGQKVLFPETSVTNRNGLEILLGGQYIWKFFDEQTWDLYFAKCEVLAFPPCAGPKCAEVQLKTGLITRKPNGRARQRKLENRIYYGRILPRAGSINEVNINQLIELDKWKEEWGKLLK